MSEQAPHAQAALARSQRPLGVKQARGSPGKRKWLRTWRLMPSALAR